MLKRKEERLSFLSQCNGLGMRTLSRMIVDDPSLKEVLGMTPKDLRMQYRISEDTGNIILNRHLQERHLKKLHMYVEHKVKVITIYDEEYPLLLKEIYDPPFVLYLKGDLKLLQGSKTISVVGTRYPSSNGMKSLEKIISPMVEKGWTIVSGLAYGIDVAAHRLAMSSNGRTIAVLGGGFDHIYPGEHKSIAEEISSSHLLVAEYPPDQRPAKWQFPMRNRIISGLSRGTLIIEAREKSGSLITGDQALQQGREVFAVPGSILEPRTAGTHYLIQQGAKLTTSAEDIFDELSGFDS